MENCSQEDHTRMCKAGQNRVLRNSILGTNGAKSVAGVSALSLPQRFCQEIGHMAVRASADTAQRRHTRLVDKRTTARPAPLVVVDVSCSRFTPDVGVALITGKHAECTKIPMGAQAVTYKFAETGCSQQERVVPVPQHLHNPGGLYI